MISVRRQMEFLYGRAKDPDDLPWHEDKASPELEQAVAAKPERGRALDLGCGSGYWSVYLARRGFDVTGVEFMPQAARMARERADAEGVELDLVEADILQWDTDETFELVMDRGTLNLIDSSDMPEYRRRLLRWLAPGGEYVLDHAVKQHPLDWRPIGPRRRQHEQLVAFFEPDLELRDSEHRIVKMPLPVGPRLHFNVYWFHRPG